MRRSAIAMVLLAACGSTGSGPPPSAAAALVVESSSPPTVSMVTTSAASSTTTTAPAPTSAASTVPPSTTATISLFARPDWLGTRLLPLRDDGFGEIQPTPAELAGRAFETVDLLPPPMSEQFTATIQEVPAAVLARSTWQDGCPVGVDQLRYIVMTHWGFDGDLHTGEMIVNVSVAEDIVWVFEQLFAVRFPIEQMRVISIDELDTPPTGDGNDTTSFVCRPVVTSTSTWSQHAFGLAVDINPFHNPYQKGDLVLPELASYYLDRSLAEPGMVVDGDVVTQAFAEIGWGWGGNWRSLDDYMHFSQNGR